MSIYSRTTAETNIVAFLKAEQERIAKLFPNIREITVGVRSDCDGCFSVAGFDGPGYNTHEVEFGSTTDEAVERFRAKVGTPESKAADLRKRAASLLAEADKLTQPTLEAAT